MTAHDLVQRAVDRFKEQNPDLKAANGIPTCITVLAAQSGVSRAAIYAWYHGKTSPKYNDLRAVLNVVDLDFKLEELSNV